MRKGLDVRHLLIYQIYNFIEGLEHVQALEIFRLRDLRVERGVEVEDRRVHAAYLKQFFALEAGLRDVLGQAVAVDARSHGDAELARVGEAHWLLSARLRAGTGCLLFLLAGLAEAFVRCEAVPNALCRRDMMRGQLGGIYS